MSRNPHAIRWEETVARTRREDGQSWKAIARFFLQINNMAGVDVAVRLAKQEQIDNQHTHTV